MKKILIAIMVITLLALTGCNDDGGENNNSTPPTFYGGSQGVIAEFEQMGVDSEGVETVWVGTEFPVEVTVKNKGEEIVEAGDVVVTIHGVDTELFNIDEDTKENEFELEKVSELNQNGGMETISFGNAMLDDVTGLFYNANFFASVVYKYKTHVAIPEVCFKEDYQEESVCDLEGSKDVFSSGAPIVVTNVEQMLAGSKKISVKFDIENIVGGNVAPVNGDFNNYYDQLNFELTEGASSDIPFTCRSAGSDEIARFNEGKTNVICTSGTLPEGTLFTKQLTLELSYKYKDLIQRTVRVRNEPN